MSELEQLEPWRRAWRIGFAPSLSAAGLQALAKALRDDDLRLVQMQTCMPPPSMGVDDWPAESACAIGYCFWQGEGLMTVGEISDACHRAACEANERLGGCDACWAFLAWFDSTPRDRMRAALLPEVELALAVKGGV